VGKITFELDDQLEEKFRVSIYKRKGLRKGVITLALIEAIKQWMDKK